MKAIITLFIFIFFILNFTLNAQTTFHSKQNGNWGTNNTWVEAGTPSSTDNVVIEHGHTVTANVNNAEIEDVTINSGGVLNLSKNLKINGNLTVNGTYTGGNGDYVDFTGGTGTTVDGAGVVKIDFNFNGNTSILSSAVLLVTESVNINSGVTVTNNGKLTIDKDLIGVNSTSSIWTNAPNSTLELSDELFPSNKGVLNASAIGNTVKYNSDINHQIIKTPSANTYYNIEFTGIKEKRAQDDLYIDGNVLINSGYFDANGNDIYVRGNWTSYSHFIEGTNLVVFDGTADQTLIRPGGEMFYDLEIDKSSGTFFVNDKLTISNSLTMTSGNIDVGNKIITLGTDAGNIGTLTHVSGNVIGKFERWIVASAIPYLFPVGTADDFRPAYPTFSSIFHDGTVIFEFIPDNPGNATLPITEGATTVYNTFIDGYWDASVANSFSIKNNTYNLDLHGTNFISFTIDATTRLLTRDVASSDWAFDGTHGTNNAPMVQRTTMATLPAQFCFGDYHNCIAPTTSAITGNTDVCTGASGETYSVTDNGNTYYWIIDGGTQITGGNTSNITVDWGTTGMVGSVTCYEKNACTYSERVVLDVNVHSIQPVNITGKTNVPENTLAETYSVPAMTGYTYTWSITGGTQNPLSTADNITVDWGVAGAGNVSVVAQKVGCNAAPATDLDVNIYIVINSVKTGDWNDATTWDCNCIPDDNDNARIVNPDVVTLDANEVIKHFTVNAGATLNMASKTFECTGDITVDGLITETTPGTKSITLSATSNIDGTGTFNAGDILILGNKTILSSALLTVSTGNIDLNNIYSYMITNNGNLTVVNDIIGKNAASKYWTNGVNSTLNIGGVLLATGELIAEASGNTVNYNGTGAQTIKDPAPLTDGYWNLTTSTSGIKTPEANLDVNGNLTINGSSQLDIATGNFNINIAGDWINSSTNADPFLQGNTTETVTFDGTGDQNIICPTTETFNIFSVELNSNTIIAAGSSVTANGATTLTGTFTLKSPTTANGISASFIDNGTINIISTGKMIAERYLNSNQWHEVSAPIISSDVNSDLFTAYPGGGFNSNFYTYDETKDLDGITTTEPAGGFDNNNLVLGWTYAHNGDGGAAINLDENKGYMFYSYTNQVISFEGEPATGNFDISGLSFTNNDPDNDASGTNPTEYNLYDGWHLIGNPYPSSIDWDLIRDDQISGIDDGIYVWDNTGYSGYKNGSSVMLGNLTNYIAPMQGFFVRANGGVTPPAIGGQNTVGNIEIKNEHRSHGATTFRKDEIIHTNYLKLKTNANEHDDFIVVQFLADATNEYDGKYDLVRMFVNPNYGDPTLPQLYSITENKKDPLALNVLPKDEMNGKTVQLGLNIGNGGTYKISVDELNFGNTQIYLEDLYTEALINLRAQNSYEFNFSGGDIKNRFLLHFNKNNTPINQIKLENIATFEDENFEYSIPENTFIDIDLDDEIILTAKLASGQQLPDWLNFKDGTFNGVPTNDNVGKYKVQIIATDLANASTSTTFTIKVFNTNDAPIYQNALSNIVISEDEVFEYSIPENTFIDIDLDDEIILTAKLANGESLPDWLSFENETFSGIPTNDNVGELNIQIIATDLMNASISANFKLEIINTNDAPIYQNNLNDINTSEDEVFEYSIPENTFIDIDLDDEIILTAKLANGESLPDWLSFENEMLFGFPTNDNVGELNIQIIATDLKNASTSANFKLEIINTNDAPFVADKIINQRIQLGLRYTFEIPEYTFDDADENDTLYIYTKVLPDWLEFNEESKTLIGTPNKVGKYKIEIFAEDIEGAITSDIFEINVFSTTITESVNLEVVNIYPNPTDGIFYINLNNNFDNAEIKIFSIDGKIILSEQLFSDINYVDISNLSSSIYSMEITIDKQVIHRRIIKK